MNQPGKNRECSNAAPSPKVQWTPAGEVSSQPSANCKYICLSQFPNVFVKSFKCIWSIVAELHFLSLSLGLSRLCGGYQATHLLTGRRVSHFPTHPRFPDFLGRISSNSRNGFTECLQFTCPLIDSPRPKPRPVSCLNRFDVKEVWMNQFYL